MRSIGITISFTLLFAALCAFTLYVVPPHIEQSIKSRVSQIIASNGLPALEVIVDGRDVTLAGEVSDEYHLAQAIELTSNTPGVRVVMSNLSVIKKEVTIRKAIVEDLVIGPIESDESEEPSASQSVTN